MAQTQGSKRRYTLYTNTLYIALSTFTTLLLVQQACRQNEKKKYGEGKTKEKKKKVFQADFCYNKIKPKTK